MWIYRFSGTGSQPASQPLSVFRCLMYVLIPVVIFALIGCHGSEPGRRLRSIEITPPECSIPIGSDRTFTAAGFDDMGEPMAFQPEWSVEGGIGTIEPVPATAPPGTTSQCVFTATKVGVGKVCCSCGFVRGEAEVTVLDISPHEDPVLTEIRMSPAAVDCTVGDTREITASGFDQYGEPIDFSPTWEVTGGVGTIETGVHPEAVTSTMIFTATHPGSGTICASCNAVVGEIAVTVQPAEGVELTNLFYLHHSTGRAFIEEGEMRPLIDNYNSTQGTSYELWDHGYNFEGLRGPTGAWMEYDYDIPGDNTYPDGLHALWTTNNSARDTIMANHGVIAFNPPYQASAIEDTAKLNQYKTWYLDMRDYFDAHPERLFVVMSPPPLHRLATGPNEAANARAFANWLKSSEYLSGHSNLVCLDLFDILAHADDGTDPANCLRYMYEQSHTDNDSEPNTQANQVVGPALVAFLINAAESYVAAPAP